MGWGRSRRISRRAKRKPRGTTPARSTTPASAASRPGSGAFRVRVATDRGSILRWRAGQLRFRSSSMRGGFERSEQAALRMRRLGLTSLPTIIGDWADFTQPHSGQPSASSGAAARRFPTQWPRRAARDVHHDEDHFARTAPGRTMTRIPSAGRAIGKITHHRQTSHSRTTSAPIALERPLWRHRPSRTTFETPSWASALLAQTQITIRHRARPLFHR